MTTATMQALATGLPTIATRHSAFPDQIKEGKNGFLVNEGDYKALANKILYYIDHPEIWPGMSRFGREHVKKNYDCEALINKQINYYKDLISK